MHPATTATKKNTRATCAYQKAIMSEGENTTTTTTTRTCQKPIMSEGDIKHVYVFYIYIYITNIYHA
jgi:hypothetical protein